MNGINYRECRRFYNAIKKYGWSAFEASILEQGLSQDEANEFEIYYINLYRSNDPKFGYNLQKGGNQKEPSEEGKQILSMKAKARYEDPSRNPMYGKTHSLDTKRKMSEKKVGVLNPMFGKSMSDESKEKRKKTLYERGFHPQYSDASLEKMRAWGHFLGEKRKKRVMCVEDNRYFESLTIAAECYGISVSTLSGHLKGAQHTCAGKHFVHVANEV